jgi:hypothetical protein
VDTLAKIRARVSGRASGNLYAEDYAAIEGLKALADAYGVALLTLTHLRKAQAEDVVDLVTGSAGLTGAADTVIVLRRPRGQSEGTLFVTGRDVEEQELAVRFDADSCLWTIIGEAGQVATTKQRQALIDVIRKHGPIGPAEIAERLGRRVGAIKMQLHRMTDEGLIQKEDKGKYVAPRERVDVCYLSDSRDQRDQRDHGQADKVMRVTSGVLPPLPSQLTGMTENSTEVTQVTRVTLDACDGCPYLFLPATWKPDDAMCQRASDFLKKMERCPLPAAKG